MKYQCIQNIYKDVYQISNEQKLDIDDTPTK